MYPTNVRLNSSSTSSNQLAFQFESTIFIGVSDLNFSLAHSTHFYSYIIFSKSFRNGFAKRFLRRKRNGVQQQQTNEGTYNDGVKT